MLMIPPAYSVPSIFVSHSSKDNYFGIKLIQDLRHALGDETKVWYDVSGGLYGGDDWWSRIVEEITTRNIFIVILSPDSMDSQWVNDEIKIAWRQKNTNDHSLRKFIIPILYRPCKIHEY